MLPLAILLIVSSAVAIYTLIAKRRSIKNQIRSGACQNEMRYRLMPWAFGVGMLCLSALAACCVIANDFLIDSGLLTRPHPPGALCKAGYTYEEVQNAMPWWALHSITWYSVPDCPYRFEFEEAHLHPRSDKGVLPCVDETKLPRRARH